LMKSTSRQIKKNSNTEEIELAILKFLKKVIRMNEKAKQEEFVKFEKELNLTLKSVDQDAILQYFNISAWVSSKVNQISFEDAVKNMNK
jgi:hypothetical protein